MSLRTLAVWLALVSAAAGAAGCSPRHAARQTPSPPAAGVSAADLRHGKAVYEAQCAACDGARGAGAQLGPSLQNEYAHHSYHWVYAFVRDPAPIMPKLYPSRLSQSDLRDVSAYVESL